MPQHTGAFHVQLYMTLYNLLSMCQAFTFCLSVCLAASEKWMFTMVWQCRSVVSGVSLQLQRSVVQGLTQSDSDSSQEAFPQEAAPVLYRLRADGRKVPITDGHGMDLARRKGLVQEVVVSPKRASQGQAGAKFVFGEPQTTQPETVALHSVELPQVQLGDREIADLVPQTAGDAAGVGGKLSRSLSLHSNTSQLQQQQRQSQTDKLMTQCGLQPREDSSHSLRNSQMLSASQPSLTAQDSSSHSMSNFSPHPSQVLDMAGSRSASVTTSSAAAGLPPGYMPWWGISNSSEAFSSRSLPLQHNSSGTFPTPVGHYLGGAPGVPRLQTDSFGQVRQSCNAACGDCKTFVQQCCLLYACRPKPRFLV